MADIATVFHWSPEVMGAMSVDELADWRERARARYESDVLARNPWVKKK
ncbi:GpE family phage tail protein [Paraburkholderia antibiotica]|uniref:GpE family phage tail protein n=1 Tax=Paraburkholderia antibiotica TaxID=2728839 RepID=A0A7X9X5H5_9BURK|nr:GpE family phage tail protein [Paraburkholderia antibiotica]NML31775.1 GpE family phage tail protein [Paraburkholderia antibiotica]